MISVVNKNSQFSNVVFGKNNSGSAVQTRTTTTPLAKNTGNDTVTLSKKRELTKKQKTWLKIGAITTAVVAAGLAIREGFIRNAQKVFKEAFLRDDISRKETIEILKKYRNIEKIKDKNEYIKAMYEEGKKNLGLKDLKLNFSIENFVKKGVQGEYSTGGASIKISKNIVRNRVVNTVHHELRHAKQANMMMNYSPLESVRAILKSQGAPFERFLDDRSFLNRMCDNYFRGHGVTREPNSVPKSLEEYVKKLIKAQEKYVEGRLVNGKPNSEYYNNFKEVDARKCGESLEKVLKWVRFWR